MTVLSLNKRLSYSRQQLFNLVADVENYPSFVPGILKTKVIPLDAFQFQSEVFFGNRIFQERYTCLVKLDPFHQIHTDSIQGPFQHLKSQWSFYDAQGGEQTDVQFKIDFIFKNKFIQRLAQPFFQDLPKVMMQAFEEQAKKLYGI